MSGDDGNIEKLNALLDGELGREERARVLEWVADTPEAARELSALARLKSTLEGSIDVPELAVPGAPAPRKWARFAVAASVMLALLGGVLLLALDRGVGAGDEIPIAWAVAAHHGWTASRPAAAAAAEIQPVAAPGAYIPDLSAAKLSIVHAGARPLERGKGNALVVGYQGSRGCRVTLVVAAVRWKVGTAPVLRFEADGVHAQAWTAGNLGYMVLAEGMARTRFELIAASVRATSLQRLPLDEPARMRLAKSRRTSAPCHA